MPLTPEEQERDDTLIAWLKDLRIAHPTAFASVVVQCPDGSYHHACLSSPESTYAKEHQRVVDAVCIAIAVASEEESAEDAEGPVH